ncbi:MAG: hypothetical protein ABIS29_05175 [Vicinamibacterales bacterium]
MHKRPRKIALDLQKPYLLYARRGDDETEEDRGDLQAVRGESPEPVERPSAYQRTSEKGQNERFGGPHWCIQHCSDDLSQGSKRRQNEQSVVRSKVRDECDPNHRQPHPDGRRIRPENGLKHDQDDSRKDREQAADQMSARRLEDEFTHHAGILLLVHAATCVVHATPAN